MGPGCSSRVPSSSSLQTTPHQRPMNVVLDFQCFKNNQNEFIVKEACVLEVSTGSILFHHVAELPHYTQSHFLNKARQRECRWLTDNYHGLDWSSGDMPFINLMEKLRELLSHQCSTIYVKGLEKRKYVETDLLPTSVAAAAVSSSEGHDEVDSSSSSTAPSSTWSMRNFLSKLPSPRPSATSPPVVIDLSDLGCASLDVIGSGNGTLAASKVRCNQHKSVWHRCALSNCSLLRSWLLVTANETLLLED